MAYKYWHTSPVAHIFEISDTHETTHIDIYGDQNLKFIIRVFARCLPLNHSIYTKYFQSFKHVTY